MQGLWKLQIALQSGRRGMRIDKKYAAMFGRNLTSAVETIVGQIRQFVYLWETEELKVLIGNNDKDARKEAKLGMEQKATMVVQSAT